MHPRLSVSGVSSWSWTLDEELAFYEQEGVHSMGLSWRKAVAAPGGVDAATRRVRDAGLTVTNVIELGAFVLDDPPQWPGQRERLAAAADAARALGAGALVAVSGRPGSCAWEEAADALEAALGGVDPRDRSLLLLEHTNPFRVDLSFLHTLRDAVDLARRLGIGVCMEINACWMERALGATVAGSLDVIRLVQVSDSDVGTRCTPDRLVPGDGDIPLARILAQAVAAGYEGGFDLEVVGPRIDSEGYASAIRRAIAHLGALLADVGAGSRAPR